MEYQVCSVMVHDNIFVTRQLDRRQRPPVSSYKFGRNRRWFFVSGATSMFTANCSDVVLFSAIGGHPQVGALRNLEQLRAPHNDYMVHLVI